jgi:colicin import membrane protein
MSLFNTEHERNSAAITTAILIVLILLMFIIGMKYMNPPEESGIAVNFGTTETGSGNVETLKTPKQNKAQTQQEEVKPQETVPEEQSETTPTETETEEVVTQDSAESIAIKKAEEAKRKADKEVKEAEAEADRIAKEKQEAEEKLKAEQAKKMADIDALNKQLQDSEGKDDEDGEGNDKDGGNKGNPNGDPYAKTYFGKPGSGTGGQGGSGLGNRTRLQTAKEIPDCDFTGRVVLEITVNRQGKVIDAKRGSGTLAAEQCLIDAALKAAYKFKWNADGNAPENQYGVIEFNFTLGGK